MKALFPLISLLLFTHSLLCAAQQTLTSIDNARGFSSATDSTKVNAIPECSAKHMIVHLKFNRTIVQSFTDWIVVGTNSHMACRHQGHGELDYIIEIPLMNDPCGTKMVGRGTVDRGTFENVIRIGQNPLIILRGDELITVRCFYGPPEIVTPPVSHPLPSDLQNIGRTESPSGRHALPFDEHQQTGGRHPNEQGVEPSRRREVVNYAYVYYLVLPILLLALLCMICGCLFALVKRRKLRIERRKQLVNSIPPNFPGSKLSKLGLSNLWWNGKSIGNDALLSHDYMISSNSTREALSVSTEYGGGSTPSSTQSDGSPKNPNNSNNNNNGQLPMPSERDPNYESVINGATVPATVTQPITVAVTHESLTQHHHIEHENDTSGRPKSYSEWRAELLAATNAKGADQSDLYTPVNRKNKKLPPIPASTAAGNTGTTSTKQDDTVHRSQMRSITEIYASMDREVRSKQRNHGNDSTDAPTADDQGSISTLEGSRSGDTYNPLINQPAASEQKHQWLQECVYAVEQQQGFGPRKLTMKEIELFRQLIHDDPNFADLLTSSTGIDDFEAIGRRPEYSQLLTRDKWTVVAQSLAHMAFMTRLSTILDNKTTANTSHNQPPVLSEKEMGPIDESQSNLMTGKRRYVKRSEHTGAPRRANAEEVLQASARYSRSHQQQISSIPKTNQKNKAPPPPPPQRTTSQLTTLASENAGYVEEGLMDTTECEENVEQILHQDVPTPTRTSHHPIKPPRGCTTSSVASSSTPRGSVDVPPTLHVYVGNVDSRPLPQSVRNKFPGNEQLVSGRNFGDRPVSGMNSAARYAAMLESNASCATTTYDNWQVQADEL